MPSIRQPIVLSLRSFIKRDDGRLLLVRRAATDTRNAGLWECPGGKHEHNQVVEGALESEIMQEVGLKIRRICELVFQDSHLIEDGWYAGHLYLVMFWVSRPVGGELVLSHEHDMHAWLTFDEMLRYDLVPEVRKAATGLREYLK
ncbi:MAG: 8-oxo-dGTP diphosphatase [Candidatus Parcubacteria bacterium]|jgi:8-oxo-dGTP diphosphatase|nr:8-oxo-dGTP diphosphatase [Candidatus Parcubacteria bacterium]